ncbi:MAG: NUDIX domain-containing protein [Nanoarchaeota archaeon]|nr:NUDIX domain-containing protein [Nanoarchaeota archaeon]
MIKAINLAIITEEGILLVKKKETWILPGGKPDFKEESDEQVLNREFSQELPLTRIKINEFYKSVSGITPHKGYELEAKVYFGKLVGIIKPSAEINDARYVKNFQDYNLSDITKKIINSLIKDKYLK